MRRPRPATIIATLALVLAAAPAGQAASGWVERALYARDAGAVDGIKASRTPHKGRLLVLPASGKLPASILPVSAGGTSGGSGGGGGSTGGGGGGSGGGGSSSTALEASASATVNVNATQTPVVSLSLPAGSYAIVAKASLHATVDVSEPDVTCLLKAGSDGDQVDADLSSSSDDPVALIATHTFGAAGTASLTCAADDVGVTATDAHILALRVGSVSSN
jgi:hypothetical protein